MTTQIAIYRVIHTGVTNATGPAGLRYVHDAARPWAVLKTVGTREFCAGRYSQEKLAKRYIRGKLAANKLEQEAA